MSLFDYERALFGYIENIRQQMMVQPLNLGGVFGPGGGAGGPPGGFVGRLPQSRVTFDTDEAEIWNYPVDASGVPSGVSLVDNLNRIRYRIRQLEVAISGFEGGGEGGGHVIQENGTPFTQRANLNFTGNVDVSDDSYNDATVVNIPSLTVSNTSTVSLSLSDNQLTANVIQEGIRLDALGEPNDTTQLDATTDRHGLLPKLSGNSSEFLNGLGQWATPGGGGGGGISNKILLFNADDNTVTVYEPTPARLRSALQAAPFGSVVMLPAGTIDCSSYGVAMTVRSGVTLRGWGKYTSTLILGPTTLSLVDSACTSDFTIISPYNLVANTTSYDTCFIENIRIIIDDTGAESDSSAIVVNNSNVFIKNCEAYITPDSGYAGYLIYPRDSTSVIRIYDTRLIGTNLSWVNLTDYIPTTIIKNSYINDILNPTSDSLARDFGTYYDDFLNSGASPQTQRGQWLITLINSGTQSMQASTIDHPGIVRFRSSTTANSGARVMTATSAFVIGGGEVTEFVFSIPDMTNTTIRMGFLDTTSSAEPTDGVYAQIVGNYITGKTAFNGTRSTTSSNYWIDTGTWYRVRIEVNESINRATYYLYAENGTLLWSDYLTSNIPNSSGRETGHGIIATNSGTTARDLIDLDYMGLTISRTLAR